MTTSFKLTHARHVLRAGLVSHNNADAAEVEVDMGYVIAAALQILEDVQSEVDALEDSQSSLSSRLKLVEKGGRS